MYTGKDSGAIDETHDSIKVEMLGGMIEGEDVTD